MADLHHSSRSGSVQAHHGSIHDGRVLTEAPHRKRQKSKGSRAPEPSWGQVDTDLFSGLFFPLLSSPVNQMASACDEGRSLIIEQSSLRHQERLEAIQHFKPTTEPHLPSQGLLQYLPEHL